MKTTLNFLAVSYWRSDYPQEEKVCLGLVLSSLHDYMALDTDDRKWGVKNAVFQYLTSSSKNWVFVEEIEALKKELED